MLHESRPHRVLAPTSRLILLVCLLGTAVSAQEGGQDTAEAGVEEPSYWKEHFALHGFVNLGFAQLEENDQGQRTADDIILGLNDDGELYGNAALNLRYTPAPKHAFVLQLAASHLGDSPVDDLGSEIELDWFFYQFQVTPTTHVRLGRQPAPAGIFNELRDVGVLLPFFRPAFTFYREGAFFSETIDGIGISHQFFDNEPWSLDASLYYGEFDVLEQGSGIMDEVVEVDVTNALGGQLWLNTPAPGALRFGLGALRWDTGQESGFSLQEETWTSEYFSIDWELERFVFRAEYRQVDVNLDATNLNTDLRVGLDLYYWQLGWHATESLSLYVQPEYTDIQQMTDIFVGGERSSRDRQDTGFGARYEFTPSLVLKAEYHDVESELRVADVPIFGPSGLKLGVVYETFEGNYGIVSFAASF